MSYKLELSPKALEGLGKLKRSERSSYQKVDKLLYELSEHPTTGTGKPEQLKGNLSGLWSRRITNKHRLIYRIKEDIVEVYVLSAYGHYDDK